MPRGSGIRMDVMTELETPAEREMAAATGTRRPRLAFFRPDRRDLPAFIRQHLDEHVRCLAGFFDVVLVEEDCSYDEVLERVQPDVALFESGVYTRPDRRITDTHRHPEVPKAGLINADAYCLTRSVFLSDMDEWGVDTFFTISMSLRDRVPQLADRLFVWPNFADAQRYHTYPGGKRRTILFAGSQASNYPWRSRVSRLLRERFPVDALAHGGWFDADRASGMLTGDSYAQELSSSLIVPTCGTIAHDLVRKHLEIPASGALLLTERTAAVEAAGFVDMETCVFADEGDVVDKVEHLLAHPEEIERISAAGQQLAHSRHDIGGRNQILRWYELTRSAAPGEVVVQPDPFGELELRPRRAADARPVESLALPRDRAVIVASDEASAAGDLDRAASGYLAALNYHYEAEAALGLARTSLRAGDAHAATDWVWDSITRCVRWHGAAEPDPVEWSVYAVSLLCAGDLRAAAAAARQYDRISHDELARVRRLVSRLTGTRPSPPPERRRLSIHQDRQLRWDAWVEEAVQMLAACGQHELAARATALASEPDPVEELPTCGGVVGPWQIGHRHRDLRRRQRVRARLGRGLRRRWPRRALPAPPTEPLPALLDGREVQTMVAVGLAPDEPAAEWVRSACRRSPVPCVLVSVGAVAPAGTSVARLLERGGNRALGDGDRLPVMLTDRSVVVVGQAASFVSPNALAGAGLVVLVDPAATGQRILAASLDAASWRRVGPEEEGEPVAAWERVR